MNLFPETILAFTFKRILILNVHKEYVLLHILFFKHGTFLYFFSSLCHAEQRPLWPSVPLQRLPYGIFILEYLRFT